MTKDNIRTCPNCHEKIVYLLYKEEGSCNLDGVEGKQIITIIHSCPVCKQEIK